MATDGGFYATADIRTVKHPTTTRASAGRSMCWVPIGGQTVFSLREDRSVSPAVTTKYGWIYIKQTQNDNLTTTSDYKIRLY